MTSILEAAKARAAEKAKQPKAPAKRPDPVIDVSDLTPFQVAKRMAAAKKDDP